MLVLARSVLDLFDAGADLGVGPVHRTQRLVGGRPAAIDDPLIVIGGFDGPAIETYEARCLRHHEVAPAGSARGVVADEAPERIGAATEG